MAKYAIGLDFGTLSVRAMLIDIRTGKEIGRGSCRYPHGVMEEKLWNGTGLPAEWALQDPRDYIDGMKTAVREALRSASADPADIVGIGIDFTSSTVLPVKSDGTPLCFLDEYRDIPDAYVKLWKHHGAAAETDLIGKIICERRESWFPLYGGKVSGEWMLPKVVETLHRAPEVYHAADRFIEALDWIPWQLTGIETRSECGAGYKMFYRYARGYPESGFFEAVDPRLKDFTAEKLGPPVKKIGEKAGTLTETAAKELGLRPGIAVGVGMIDAHASFLGTGITEPGIMLIILGTSACHILLSEREQGIPGVGGLVRDGILPGYFAYEAGQCCVGDHFDWFARNCVPEAYYAESRAKGIGIFELLNEKLKGYKAGESGLLALDWFNGVRTPLNDYDLNGLILGLNLQTKPEEIYLSLIEATAFGTKRILEQFEDKGIPVKKIVMSGGIPVKNRMLVQVYADVCGREIGVCADSLSGCRGAAMLGIAAADPVITGYAGLTDVVRRIGMQEMEIFQPDKEASETYHELYTEYRTLSDYFGSGGNDVMKRLNALRRRQKH